MTGDNMLNYDFYSTMRMYIVIIPKIGGTLSIICSAFVAQDVLKFPERRAKMTNHVILALSISDIIFTTNCHNEHGLFLKYWCKDPPETREHAQPKVSWSDFPLCAPLSTT